MREVKVRPGGAPEPTWKTFEQAVTAGRRHARAVRAKADSELLAGADILDSRCTTESVTFRLSNDRTLRIYLHRGVVHWDVGSAGIWDRTGHETDPKPLMLRFPDGERYEWHPKEILASLGRRRIVLLSATETWVFLYCEGRNGLMFSQFLVGEGLGRMLFFDDE